MKTYRLALFVCILTALLLNACAAAATPAPSVMEVAPLNGSSQSQAKGSVADSAAQAPNAPRSLTQSTGGAPAQERIVIQNDELYLVVKDPQAKMKEIGALALRRGGFVVSSNLSQVSYGDNQTAPQASISIRVPAVDLDGALEEIKTGVIEVRSENRTGQDVTDKYVDLQSQLKAKQAAADQLYQIMQKTEKAEDTLAVFNQLSQVNSDIEVLKGQINYFDQASTLSEINIHLLAEETVKPLEIAGWKPQGVARDAVQALIQFFQGFLSFLIWLVIFILPVVVVIVVLLALLWRLLRWLWLKLFPRKTPPAPPAQ